jgi:hypothetical protein
MKMSDRGVTLYVVAVMTAATAVLLAGMASLAMRVDTERVRATDEVLFDTFVSTLHIRAKNDLAPAVTENGLRTALTDRGERQVSFGKASVTYRYIPRDTFFGDVGALREEEREVAMRVLPEVMKAHDQLAAFVSDPVSRISDEWTRKKLGISAGDYYGGPGAQGYCTYFPKQGGSIDVNTAPVEAIEVFRNRLGDELADALITMRRSAIEISEETLVAQGLFPTRSRLSPFTFTTRGIDVLGEFEGGRMKRSFVVHLRLHSDKTFGLSGYEEIH